MPRLSCFNQNSFDIIVYAQQSFKTNAALNYRKLLSKLNRVPSQANVTRI